MILPLYYGRYVQHPIAVKALGGDKAEVSLPMYLTKKERKRIRKSAREEREREKRDKMMMGLLPPPEPKFKLSNFMKVLGDQAIAGEEDMDNRINNRQHLLKRLKRYKNAL